MTTKNLTNKRIIMNKITLPFAVMLVFLLSSMLGCVPAQGPTPEETVQKFMNYQAEGTKVERAVGSESANDSAQLPVRYQKPTYMLSRPSVSYSGDSNAFGEFSLPVGADISTPLGPRPLGAILGQIAAMKNMSTSYATDVDQGALISVNIRAGQDFFKAIDNILRPLDYFYEVEDNTLIVKYKETRKYHIAMPFINSVYKTGIGGNVLGNTEGTNMDGTLAITSSDNKFDIWENIQTNLDKILDIWSSENSSTSSNTSDTTSTASVDPGFQPFDTGAESTTTNQDSNSGYTPPPKTQGKGFYTIDRPIGLVTVTAPRSMLAKIDTYFKNLKSELYRQVAIEAKIVEVTLSENNTTGLDWSSLFTSAFKWDVELGPIDQIHVVNKSNITNGVGASASGSVSFETVLDLMQNQGHVEVLSNPNITVLNGHPAMISVGENRTYVDNITETVEDGVVSISASTASVMSGLGFGIIASIVENGDIILSITPVTTELELDAAGSIHTTVIGGNTIGLPRIKIREMQTIVRVKDGEMLIVGGLIDQTSSYNNDKVSGLGELPVIGKMFRTDGTNKIKRELVILLRPKIISM